VNQISYSREALLEWVRHNAPDLRIGRGGDEEYFSRFTFNGSTYEDEATGPNARDEIVKQAVEIIRAAMNLPPIFVSDERDELPMKIVAASLAGDEESAKQLTHQLVTKRADRTRILGARTNFARRATW
jgi:hypothetical protein